MSILTKISDVDNFNVGGGAASALAGSQASGMIGMVANLSLKKDYGLSDEIYLEIVGTAKKLSDDLLEGAEEDEVAFLKIRNAYKLPKGTNFEKNIRKNAVQFGFISAANTPLKNAYLCKEVYTLGVKLLKKSNPNAETDLEIAIDLAKLGLNGCIKNVRVNLSMINDEDILKGFKNHLQILTDEQGSVY
jgi:formiminotetrahydrofolate cyclodeaminase